MHSHPLQSPDKLHINDMQFHAVVWVLVPLVGFIHYHIYTLLFPRLVFHQEGIITKLTRLLLKVPTGH